jgi:hypothetical protein
VIGSKYLQRSLNKMFDLHGHRGHDAKLYLDPITGRPRQRRALTSQPPTPPLALLAIRVGWDERGLGRGCSQLRTAR